MRLHRHIHTHKHKCLGARSQNTQYRMHGILGSELFEIVDSTRRDLRRNFTEAKDLLTKTREAK